MELTKEDFLQFRAMQVNALKQNTLITEASKVLIDWADKMLKKAKPAKKR